MRDMGIDGIEFRAADYGPEVAAILGMYGNGNRPMPLEMEKCVSDAARERVRTAALPKLLASGLYVYLSCFDEAHTTAQDIETQEGSYWHAIVHRLEPDAGNAAYWFRQVGKHPIFPALARAAGHAGAWDPLAFVTVCDEARRQAGIGSGGSRASDSTGGVAASVRLLRAPETVRCGMVATKTMTRTLLVCSPDFGNRRRWRKRQPHRWRKRRIPISTTSWRSTPYHRTACRRAKSEVRSRCPARHIPARSTLTGFMFRRSTTRRFRPA